MAVDQPKTPKAPKVKTDPETKALTGALSGLDECDESARRRVMLYLVSRYLPEYLVKRHGEDGQK